MIYPEEQRRIAGILSAADRKLELERRREGEAFENYILEKLIEKGWRFVPPDELERESFNEPRLLNNLVRAINSRMQTKV